MQTFLPFVDFNRTAKVLDRQRLGKQRVEAYQILLVVAGRNPESRWRNHPAVKMWFGYEAALLEYAFQMVFEWRRRGYNDTMASTLNSEFPGLNSARIIRPHWLGDQRLHSSHRASLLCKKPEHYSLVKPRWKEEPKIDYFWPAPLETAMLEKA